MTQPWSRWRRWVVLVVDRDPVRRARMVDAIEAAGISTLEWDRPAAADGVTRAIRVDAVAGSFADDWRAVTRLVLHGRSPVILYADPCPPAHVAERVRLQIDRSY
jgi:hypothetical protein